MTWQVVAPVQPIAVPERHFSYIHLDLVGPLPSSDCYSHLLTVIERSTRWLEAIPLRSTMAMAIANTLALSWVVRFGVPQDLTLDRGVQVTSEMWAVQLKDALRLQLAGKDWLAHLPWVLLGLRAAPKEDSGISSAEMVLGHPLLLSGQPYLASSSRALPLPSHLPTRRLTYAEAASGPMAQLMGADFVYIKGGC